MKSFLHKGQAPSCGEGGQVPTREARGACRSASLAASVRSLSPCDGPCWATVTVVGALWPRAGSQQPCCARGRSWAHPLAGRSSCRRRRGPGLVSARLEVGGEHPGRVGAGGPRACPARRCPAACRRPSAGVRRPNGAPVGVPRPAPRSPVPAAACALTAGRQGPPPRGLPQAPAFPSLCASVAPGQCRSRGGRALRTVLFVRGSLLCFQSMSSWKSLCPQRGS